MKQREWAPAFAGIASLIAIYCGAKVWWRENAYAASHPYSELSNLLQTVGAGVFFIGVAGVVLAWLLYRGLDDS